MSDSDNMALVHRYFSIDPGQMSKDAAVGIDEFHAPDFVIHTSTGDMNQKEYVQYNADQVAAFPDSKLAIEDMFAHDDKVAVRFKFTGTHQGTYMGVPSTGKKITTEGICILKITGGKLVEMWWSSDVYGFMQQIGAIPGGIPVI